MKRIITLAAIVSIASFLTGCCCYGPYGYNCAPCGPYGGACDSCPATAATSSDLFTPCGVGGCNGGACYGGGCGPVCGPVCGPNNYCDPCNSGFYGYPCCPLLTIISIPFRAIEELWMCAAGHWPNTGCSQIYWGEWSDPPCPDPCCFDSYAGPCSSRYCGATACRGTIGCNSGCASCDGGFGGYGNGMIYDGAMEGEVIMDSTVPMTAPGQAPGRPQVIQPTPAPAPGTSTSNCRSCNQNRQAAVQTPTTYRAAKTANGSVQQIQYQQPVQKTYAPAQPNNVNVPNDIMNQLPPGAVIVSDEVASAQVSVKAGGDAYAPVLPNSPANQWKSAAVKRTMR